MNKSYKISIPIVAVLLLAGCEESEFKLESKAENFFFLEHKEAYMPVWIEGNTASKVFLIHVHGGPGGESMSSFNIFGKAFTDPLEKRYANVYYDQRYSGSAQGTFDSKHLTEEQYAEDLHMLVLLLEAKYGQDIRVFVMGSSWGGRLTARYLLNDDYRPHVAGWLSLSGAVDFVLNANAGKDLLEKYARLYIDQKKDVGEWSKILKWAEKKDTLITQGGWGEQNNKGWEAMKLVEDSLDSETPIKTGSVFKSAFFSPTNILSVLVQSAMFPVNDLEEHSDISAGLAKVQTPSLLMAGKFDFVVAPAVAETAFMRLGTTDKKLVIFDRSAHNIPFNETSKFVEEVISFVEAYK